MIPIPYRWLALALLTTVLIAASITPAREQAQDTTFEWVVVITPTPLQKLLHVVLYALLAFGLAWAMEHGPAIPLRYLLAFGLAVGLGAGLEWVQTMVPGRFGTLFDVMLDAGGAGLGVLLAMLLLR